MALNSRKILSCNMALAIWSCVALLGQSVRAQDDKPKNEKELQVLAKYIGTWESAGSNGEDASANIILDGEWILEGTFLQRRGRLSGGRTQQLQLLTYDDDIKQYRMWNFGSFSKNPIESRGTWDEARQTMTWVADLSDGGTLTQTATFHADSTQSWTTQFRGADGEGVGPERSGKRKRTDDPNKGVTK